MDNLVAAEIWQVEVNGQIYEADFEELTQWIAEGSLLPQDKVRRGNLRWIEAGKVPLLHRVFNAKELGITQPAVLTTTLQTTFENSPNNPTAQTAGNNQVVSNYSNPGQTQNTAEKKSKGFCLVHIETKPEFICKDCNNVFCKECPQSYGGTVKICPMCGGMCNLLDETIKKEQRSATLYQANKEGFGFVDLGRAIVYPFRFCTSFFFGALFYAFFAIGQHASSLGGRWLISASIICVMLTNMLTFGILANIVENMLNGRADQNFMPTFDDFTLWDDVIHPLFLSISTYLASFGPFIILCLGMIYFAVNTFDSGMQPLLQNEFGSAQQSNEQINMFKDSVKKREEYLKQRIQSAETGDTGNIIIQTAPPSPDFDKEKEIQKLNEIVTNNRRQQLQSNVDPDVFDAGNIYRRISGVAFPFILAAGMTILWAIFYYPVSLIVASYTRNAVSVLNPLVGLDTIRRLGFDYVKILFFGFMILIIGGIISLVLHMVFAPFNLPRLGNLPAVIVGSVFTFYLSIVFSLLIGFALYKNLGKFQLYRSK